MELKAIYAPAAGRAGIVVKDKETGADMVCVGVDVVHTGLTAEQNFNRRTFVIEGMTEGWLSLSEDGKTLTIKSASDGDVVYDVLRAPGYYCISTGDRIPLSKFAEEESFTAAQAVMAAGEARKWLEAKGQPLRIKVPKYAGSDETVEVSNYEAIKAYECRLRPEHHAKMRGVPGPAGKLVRVGTKIPMRDGSVAIAGAEA